MTTKTIKTITAKQFIEQIKLNAEVIPLDSPYQCALQVGRFQPVCDLQDLDLRERGEFERLYRAGKLRFCHPGDFRVLPYFFRCGLNTRQTNL